MGASERYHVLFVDATRQSELCRLVADGFPRDRGRVFLPLWEHYRRDRGGVELKAMFPGYIFVRTDMDTRELHGYLKTKRKRAGTFIRELGLDRFRDPKEGLDEDGLLDVLPELNEKERMYFDRMLDEDGIERMSYAYLENGKAEIVEGPLAGMSGRIRKIDRHNRVAWMDFQFHGHDAMAGLTIKPKRLYFPDDKEAPELLADGTEVDLMELKRKMMGG